jgi:hypothetical protein
MEAFFAVLAERGIRVEDKAEAVSLAERFADSLKGAKV